MRPRKHDRHLPACVYLRSGSYYYVKQGKWLLIGRDLASALHEYARIVAQPTEGMPAIIEAALPAITSGKSESTQAQYRSAARRLQDALAEFRPEQVRHGDVVQLLDAYAHMPAVANRLLVVLRLVFRWALDRGLVAADPCVSVKRLRQPTRDRLLTAGEYEAIRSQAPARLQIIMDLAYLTGQRIGDVLAIRRADLGDEGIAFTQQKTGKRLIVGWTPELRDAVARAKALTGNLSPMTLFYARGGATPKHQNVWRAFKASAERAGVRDVTLHDLRAMAGTDADAQGLDATALLGHTDRRTTQSYLRDKRPKVVAGPAVRPRKAG